MPLYEYQCLTCHKEHEIIQKFSDKPLKTCPDCGGKLQKKVSLSGFQLKGGGWYKDGYSSPKPEAPKQSSPSVASAPASGAPSESPKKEKSGPTPAATSSRRPASKS